MAASGRKPGWGFLILACAVLSLADAALGADLGSDPGAGPAMRRDRDRSLAQPWTLSFTPYGWLPALNGHTTVKGRTTDIDADPFEVLGHLDGVPWMSYAEARTGRLALYNDVFYAPLGADGSATRSFGRASLDATLGVDIEQTIVEAGAIYEIARWPGAGASYTALDVLGGARYWHQNVDINLSLTAALDVAGLELSRTRAIARAGGVDWVDPLVGLRVRHQLAPGHDLLLRGDVGGFDVGSQFSWNVLAAYNWQFAVHAGVTYSGMLGYRALAVDFEKGSGTSRYEYDVIQHGPVVGLTMSF